MPVYHVALFKFKPGVSDPDVSQLKEASRGLVDKIPGLKSLEVGTPHPTTAHLTQGYDMGVVAVLESPESINVYAQHPEHLKVKEMGEALCTSEFLVFDLEF